MALNQAAVWNANPLCATQRLTEGLVRREEVHIGVLIRRHDRWRDDTVVAKVKEILADSSGVCVGHAEGQLKELRGERWGRGRWEERSDL